MAPRTPKAATPSSASKGTKRVRIPDDPEAGTPAKSPKAAKAATPASATRSKKDLKDKTVAEIEPIHAADAPEPSKSALKKAAPAKGKAPAAKKEKAADKVALEAEEEEEAGDEEEIDFIKGFEESGDEADSSDEEDAAEATAAPFKLAALPAVAGGKKGAVEDKVAPKGKKAAKTGTIYLGRIPHGFHEDEMRSYFSQFGEITRLRLSRNKHSGASKHYAFVEFKYASVAQIVHETMDNYLLAGHILVCKVVPEDEVHPKLWIGANRKFRPVPKGRRDLVKRTAERTEEQEKKVAGRLVARENKKRDKLKALGIEYDFDGYAKKEVPQAVEDAPTPAKKAKKVAEPKKKGRKST